MGLVKILSFFFSFSLDLARLLSLFFLLFCFFFFFSYYTIYARLDLFIYSS